MADQGSGQQRPAGWKKDPSGRHYGRWWDGSHWTAHVISAERVQSVDPLPPRPEPAVLPEVALSAPADRTAPTQTEKPAVHWRGVAPTASGRTPDARRLRASVPQRPPEADPRGKGTNEIVAAVRGWPRWARWAAGAGVAVILIAAAAIGSDDKDQPVSVVGEVATTLRLPLASTVTGPPVTEAPTTEATAPASTRPPATTTPPTTAATAPATTKPAAVYYANCAAARAAGAAPVHRGDPGYGSHLDRDNDGVGCE